MATVPLKFTSVPVTSKFGWRTLKSSGKRNLHKGVDTANGKKYPHSAFGAGRITFAGRRPVGHPDYERGIHVIIEHAPGIDTSAHSLSALNVKTGDWVEMGDIVGWAGSSAVGANGWHVHNGLWLGGVYVDALKYLTPGKIVNLTYGATAGGPAVPINNTPAASPPPAPIVRKKNMYLHWDTSGTGWFICEAWVTVDSPQHYALLRRMIAGKEDTFNRAEVDIMNNYISRSRVAAQKQLRDDIGYVNETGPWSNKLILEAVNSKAGATIDSAAIAKSVAEAVVKQIATQGVKVDATAIATAVDAALLDNFAGIPKAVNDEAATARLSKK